jgi:hypothetical protein
MPGCPGPITITSGLGAGQVPFVAITAGHLLGAGTAELLKAFNTLGAELAMKHCAPICVATWQPATSADIEYLTQDFSGWTEVQIQAIATAHPSWLANPVILPAGTVKRGAIVKPKKANVTCFAPPPAPRPAKVPDPPRPPTGEPPIVDPPEPKPCKQPAFQRPAGTLVVEKRFAFDPIGGVNEKSLDTVMKDWVDNELPAEMKRIFDQWQEEVDKECLKLNGGRCRGTLDPNPPKIKTVSGTSGLGAQLFEVYRVELEDEVKGICK